MDSGNGAGDIAQHELLAAAAIVDAGRSAMFIWSHCDCFPKESQAAEMDKAQTGALSDIAAISAEASPQIKIRFTSSF